MPGRNELEMMRLDSDVRRGVEEAARYVGRRIFDLATVGTGGGSATPGTPVGTFGVTSDSPGRARSGGRLSLNGPSTFLPPDNQSFYPIPGDDHADAVLAELELGDTIFFRNLVPYSGILEGGRRPDSNGRMIGSEQAPDGFLRPSFEAVQGELTGWRFKP